MADSQSFISRLPKTQVSGLETVVPSFGDVSSRPAASVFPDIGERELAGGAKPIDLEAREKLGGFVDEFAQFEDVVTPNTPATTPQFPDEFAEFSAADDLDVRSTDDLTKDRDTFNPVTFFEQNPNIADDPAKLQKLLQIYRARREEGLVASQVAKAAVKETPGMIRKLAGGVVDLGARAIDLTLQPVVNVLGAVLTKDIADPQRRKAFFTEARGDLKKAAGEVSAGTESATVGLVDLSRQGIRKLDTPVVSAEESKTLQRLAVKAGRRDPSLPITEPVTKTDQDLLQEISSDIAFRKQASEILGGEGEAVKAVGLDQETLTKEGITLDKQAIENLSLVDPLTMVAGAGVFRLVSAGGKVIATSKTLSGVEKVATGLGNIAKSATKSTTKFVAGRSIQGAGKLTTLAGESLRSPAVISTTALGSIMAGGGIPTSLGAAIAARGASKAARVIGPKIEAAGAKIATEGSTAINALSELAAAAPKVAEGAALGAASTAPLAALSDDDQAAGAILGAGIALGAVGAGAERGFQVVKSKAAQTLFGPNRAPIPDVPSAAYGVDKTLDFTHQEQIAKLPEADRAEVNNFRELVRPGGGKFYATDRATFRKKIADKFAAETGKELSPEALDKYEQHHALFDEVGPDGEKIVYLNSDIKGLQHDAGHIFDALLPDERRKELRDAVKKAFPEDDFTAFKKLYDERAGTKLTDEAMLNEFVSEQFSALFRNVPANELSAPKTLLSKFGNAIAEQAEKWGVDLTGGAKTPDLNAPVSVSIRTMFRDAARTVAEAGKPGGTPGPRVEPPITFPGGDVPPPSPPTGGSPTPPVTPGPPAPGPAPASAAPTPPPTTPLASAAPNIRVTKAQQDSFSHRNAETGIARARELAAADPETSARVEEISKSLEAGNPVLEIEHLGITSETPAAGRRTRVGEQEGGYAELDRLQIENRAEAPASVISRYQKTFSPVRWVEQGGNATLIASSMDKVISNITKVAKESVGKGVDDLIPYKIGEDGKFTADSWDQIMKDNTAYGENQANGFRGDGKKLIRPGVDVGLSIPAENPNYTPTILSDDVMNFHNLIQGLNTPGTAREIRGQTPGNIKGQLVAEANKRTLLEPASIRPRNVGKQEFVSFPGRKVAEVNPLRRDLIAKGVDIDSLLPATERLRAKDIVSVKPRPELTFRAAQTDLVRGGFLPNPSEFRQKSLGGRTVAEFSEYILNASPEEWKAATENMTGGLTGGAWNLGLGLKDAADLGVLKTYQEKLSTATKEAMQAGNFDAAYSLVSKGQFFRESFEAGSGTGSAGAAFKRNVMGTEGVKVPFPQEEPKK